MLDGQNPEGAFSVGVERAIAGAKIDAMAMARTRCCEFVKLSIVYYDNNGLGWTDGGKMSSYYKIMRQLQAFYTSTSEGPLKVVVP
jgi:hypothetical protein